MKAIRIQRPLAEADIQRRRCRARITEMTKPAGTLPEQKFRWPRAERHALDAWRRRHRPQARWPNCKQATVPARPSPPWQWTTTRHGY